MKTKIKIHQIGYDFTIKDLKFKSIDEVVNNIVKTECLTIVRSRDRFNEEFDLNNCRTQRELFKSLRPEIQQIVHEIKHVRIRFID